jgi:hypothetical protein
VAAHDDSKPGDRGRLLKTVFMTLLGLLLLGVGMLFVIKGLVDYGRARGLGLCLLGAILCLYPFGVRL